MNKTGQGGDKRRHSSGSGPGVSISLTGSMKRSRSICPDQVPSHWSSWSRDRNNQLPLARRWCGRCRGSWPRSQGSPPSAAAAAPGTANIPPLCSYLPFKAAKIFTRILSRGARFSVEEEEESSSSEDSRSLFGLQTSDVEDSSAASSAHLTPAVTRRTRSESPALNSSNQR